MSFDHAAMICLIALSASILCALFFCIGSQSVSVRLLLISVIHTLVIGVICLLSALFGEEFLLDAALVYALLSFLSGIVLTRMIAAHFRCSDEPGAKEVTRHAP